MSDKQTEKLNRCGCGGFPQKNTLVGGGTLIACMSCDIKTAGYKEEEAAERAWNSIWNTRPATGLEEAVLPITTERNEWDGSVIIKRGGEEIGHLSLDQAIQLQQQLEASSAAKGEG